MYDDVVMAMDRILACSIKLEVISVVDFKLLTTQRRLRFRILLATDYIPEELF